MEGEAFNPSPQSSMEREGKELEDVSKSQGDVSSSSTAGDQSGQTTTWRDMVQAKVQPLMRSAEAVRQTIGQGTAAAQSRLQPIANHPYVQRSSAFLSKGAEQVSSSAGRTTETARKIYNKEEGYEPANVAPYFAGSLAVLLLCIFLAGQWQLLTMKPSQFSCAAR